MVSRVVLKVSGPFTMVLAVHQNQGSHFGMPTLLSYFKGFSARTRSLAFGY